MSTPPWSRTASSHEKQHSSAALQQVALFAPLPALEMIPEPMHNFGVQAMSCYRCSTRRGFPADVPIPLAVFMLWQLAA